MSWLNSLHELDANSGMRECCVTMPLTFTTEKGRMFAYAYPTSHEHESILCIHTAYCALTPHRSHKRSAQLVHATQCIKPFYFPSTEEVCISIQHV